MRFRFRFLLFGMPRSVLNLCYLLNYYYYCHLNVYHSYLSNESNVSQQRLPIQQLLLQHQLQKKHLYNRPNNDSDDLPEEQNTGLYCEYQEWTLHKIFNDWGWYCETAVQDSNERLLDGPTHTPISTETLPENPIIHPYDFHFLEIRYDLHDVDHILLEATFSFEFWALLLSRFRKSIR